MRLVRPGILLDARIGRTYQDHPAAVRDLDGLILRQAELLDPNSLFRGFPRVNGSPGTLLLCEMGPARHQPWINDGVAARRALLGLKNAAGITDLKGGNDQECER